MKRTLLFLAASLAAACGQSATPASAIALEGLTLETPGITFPTETSIQLTAWAHYTDGSKVNVSSRTQWSSSLPSIAQIGSSGIVHFAGVGSARIGGGFEGKAIAVTLNASSATLRSLDVSSMDSGGLARGDTRRFTATARFSDGTSIDVTSRAQWTSDGSVIATTETAGLVVARAQGQGVVHVSYFGQQASSHIQVMAPRFRSFDLVYPNVVIRPGDMHTLAARATYSDGSMRDVTNEASWTSSDAAIFALGQQPGVVFAYAPGRARITASWNGSTASAQLEVLVHKPTLLSFDSGSVQVPSGRSARAQLWAWFDDGSRLEIAESAVWSSSQPAVAVVADADGAKGVVTAVALGSATIRAEFAGLVASYQFESTSPVLDSLSASLSGGRLVIGQAADFTVSGTWSDGTVINLSSEVQLQHGTELVSSLQGDRLRVVAAGVGAANVTLEFGGLSQQVPFDVTSATIASVEVRSMSSGNGAELGPIEGERRFRAYATWSDGVTQEVTELCNWWVDDAAIALMSDAPGTRGAYGLADGGLTSVRASLNGQITALAHEFPANP